MRVLKNFAVATTMAVFALSRNIKIWSDSYSRFCCNWGSKDALALVMLLLLAGITLMAVYELTSWFGLRRCRRFLKWSFLVLTVFLVGDYWVAPLLLRILHAPHIRGWLVIGVPLLAAYVVLAALMARRIDRLARVAHSLFLIFSPIVPIVVCQLFSYHTWEEGSNRTARRLTEVVRPQWATSTNGVVLFVIFDEWSAQRSLADYQADYERVSEPMGAPRDVFISDLACLNTLSRQALLFRGALTPGDCTDISMPSLIYEKAGRLSVTKDQAFWNSAEGAKQCGSYPTIFDAARERGYVTALMGFYFPFERIAPGRFDAYWFFPYYKKGDGLLSRMFWIIPRSAMEVHNPAISLWAIWRYWYHIVVKLDSGAVEWTRNAGPCTFLFLHLATVHPPFVVRPDGSCRPLLPSVRWEGTERDYSNALRQLDEVVGRLVAVLKQSGQYEAATIVLTGDHSWRHDPLLVNGSGDWMRHVPLVIKCPGQEFGQVLDTKVETIRLGRVLRLAFEGRAEPRSVLEIMCVGDVNRTSTENEEENKGNKRDNAELYPDPRAMLKNAQDDG